MSRYLGPKLKITRRLGVLPGLTLKKSKKSTNIDKKSTEYAIRLKEKQKLKFNYGLNESQLYSCVKEARRKKGITGLILLQLLEMRLDTLCFTIGYSKSLLQARQMVNHGHFKVNGKVLNIPSFQCQIGDLINIRETSPLKVLIESNLKNYQKNGTPSHIKLNTSTSEAKILNYCSRDDVSVKLDELLVIEHYSRR